MLLGERRKFGGVQGALSRAALVAPAGAKLPLLVGQIGGKNARGGTTTPPLAFVVPTPDPCHKQA